MFRGWIWRAPGQACHEKLFVHLHRGMDASFSFDFDSQWHFVFLDSVEAFGDLNGIPSLGEC